VRIWIRIAAALTIAALATGPWSSARADEAARPADSPFPSVFRATPFEMAVSGDAAATADAESNDSLRSPADFHMKRRFLRSTADVLTVNYLFWAVCRYVREGGTLAEFRISWRSIHENLKAAWNGTTTTSPPTISITPTRSPLLPRAAVERIRFLAVRSLGVRRELALGVHVRGEPRLDQRLDHTSLGGVALGEALYRLSTWSSTTRRAGAGARGGR